MKNNKLYVIIEQFKNSDGAIHLSKELAKELGAKKEISEDIEKNIFLFVAWNKTDRCFSIIKVNKKFTETAYSYIVSYSNKTKSFGFTPNAPNVPQLFYKLNVEEDTEQIKLMAIPKKIKDKNGNETKIYNLIQI
ncbi:MAG: hypothetical protein RR280_08720 [Bacteroidaceae bacterium]